MDADSKAPFLRHGPPLGSLLLLLGLVLALGNLALAETRSGEPLLTISPIDTQVLGKPVYAEVSFSDEVGRPLANRLLISYLDGEQLRRGRTEEDGSKRLYLGRDLSVGTHEIRVVTVSQDGEPEHSASTTFTIRPARLTIGVVPPLEGISFHLNGDVHFSDENGHVAIEVDRLGTHTLNVTIPPIDEETADTKIEFERWMDTVFTPEREVRMRGDKQLFIGFSLSYRIDQAFFDLQGNPFDPTRISSWVLKNSSGTRWNYPNGQPRWRKANRISRLKNGLEPAVIQYSIEQVIIDGSNVVNKNQQRFTVDGPTTWPVELLLYSARLRAEDAALGHSVGDGVILKYPDDHTQHFPFDSGGEVFIDQLARGKYTVQVTGVSGMAPETPMALSRDQDVDLKVLTNLTMLLGVSLGATFALTLLFIGRPHFLTWPWRTIMALRRSQLGRDRSTGRL